MKFKVKKTKTLTLANEEELPTKYFIPKNKLNPEIVNELKRNKGYRKIYDFTRDKMISACGDHTKNGGITMDKANNEQMKLAQ